MNAPLGDNYISAKVVAQKLGVTEQTIKQWDYSGLLPRPRKIARTKRYSEREIDQWFAAGCPHRSEWEAMQGEQLAATS